MQQVILGNSGLKVSKLVFGTLTLGPLQKNYDLDFGQDLIEFAFENGITAFDTAQYYKTQVFLKNLLKKHKDATVISKSYAYDLNGAKAEIDQTIKEIGRDYIDVFLMHEQESEHTIRGHKEALEYYLTLKEKGIIGHVGISTHRVSGVLGACKYKELEIIHPMINIGGMGINDGTRSDMENALSIAKSYGKGIYGMKVLAGGNYINNREAAFDYALSQKSLDAVAIGMCSKEEILYNINYINGDKEKARLIGAKIKDKHLHIEPWCVGCGKCIKACEQKALTLKDGKIVCNKEKCVLCGYCAPRCDEFAIKVI